MGGAASANAEGLEEANLLQYSYVDSEELVEEFEMGNLLLYTEGTAEQGDDGVIDDSVLTEEDDTGGIDEDPTEDVAVDSGYRHRTFDGQQRQAACAGQFGRRDFGRTE